MTQKTTSPSRSTSSSKASGKKCITIPMNWRRRDYQRPFFQFMESGGTRAVLRWHRRSGKDEVCLHWTAVAAMTRIGNYWHLLPQYGQARKAVWNAINPHTGKKRIDEAFPKEIRKQTRQAEMMIELVNGSTWQLVGSDNFDTLVGAPPVGLVFSEYALSNPLSWDYLRPMLAENGGWAVFNATVRGRNHFWKLGEFARGDPDWYFSDLQADETNVLSKDVLDRELRELCATWGKEDGASRWKQEYFNDPTVAMPGAFYSALLAAAEADGRIGAFPPLDGVVVNTSWDLGQDSETAIWFWQNTPTGPRFIDYLHARNRDMAWYAGKLRAKGYRYGRHIVPFDIKVHEWAGKTRIETAAAEGLAMEIAPQMFVIDGIEAVKRMLPGAVFDADACSDGLDALSSYHSELDEEKRTLRVKAVADWSSHGADSMRYMAISVDAGVYTAGGAVGGGDDEDKWGF